MNNSVPTGWSLQPLSALAHYYNGRAFKPEDWSSEGLPIIRIAQINNKNTDLDYYAGDDVSDKNRIINGDLLFSWSATLTALIWNRGDAVLNQHIFKVEEKAGVDRKYLHQVILNSIEPLADYSHGSTMKHIKKGVLDEYCVGTPPLHEQQKIATILSSVDNVIEKTRAQIDKLKDLKTGMMQELLTKGIGHTEFKESPVGSIPVGWQVKTLGELADFWSGYAFKSSELSEQGTKVVRISNLHKPDFPYWRYDGKIKNTWVAEKGDVLFTWAGVANSINVHHYMGERALLNQHIYNFKFENDEIKFWVYQILKSLLPHLKANIEGGAGQLHLTKPFIQAIAIPMPQQDERAKIAGILEAIDSRINAIEAKVKEVTLLKKALMQDLLTGKVRVNLTDKESAVV